MGKLAKELKDIIVRKISAEKRQETLLRKADEQKKAVWWKSLNKKTSLEAIGELRRLLLKVKNEKKSIGSDLFFSLVETDKLYYQIGNSEDFLNKLDAYEIKEKRKGRNKITYVSTSRKAMEVYWNLLAEKLIALIEQDGLQAEKHIHYHSHESGIMDMSWLEDFYNFGIKISWQKRQKKPKQ
jgi:hypothetical protein